MKDIETGRGRTAADGDRRRGPQAIIEDVQQRIDSPTAPKPARA